MRPEIANRLVFLGFVAYVLVLLGVQCGHLYWLLKVHTDLRTGYGLDPQTASHSWGFAGAALLLIVMVIGPFCVTWLIRKYGETDCSWSGGRKWIMFFWPVSLSIYNGQVILFIVSTVNLFLDLKWDLTIATCVCHNETDPLLNLTWMDDSLVHCQCVVPNEDCPIQLSANDEIFISDIDLQRRGSNYHGNVSTVLMDSMQEVNQWLETVDIDRNFQYVFVLAKLSALVTVLHFPLWLLDHYLLQMASSIQEGHTESREPGSTRSKVSEIVTELMTHSVYCFSENIDGFSLLDEYLELAVFFSGNGYLRDAVLAFLGSNIILISGYNGIAHLLKGRTLVNLIVRCLIVMLNNLPFMILRIYLLWHVGGSRILEVGVSTTFFFFVAKEAIFLVVYFMECGFSIYQYRVDGKKTSYEKQNSTLGSTQSTTLQDSLRSDDLNHAFDRSVQFESDLFCETSEEFEPDKRRKKRQKLAKRQDSLLEDDQLDHYH